MVYLISPGELIKERWKVIRKIGGGGFGDIYEALEVVTQEKVALKLESVHQSKQVLKMEVTVLRRLQNRNHICKFFSCGRNRLYSFIVMSLQGRNLADLRRSRPRGQFSISTTVRLSLQILDAIKTIHQAGFLHRDIKPSNFAIGRLPTNCRTIYILDFGLARQYKTETGRIRSERQLAGFRGTVRYASRNAHMYKEMGCHDDLWSMFYMLVEFASGQLPWRQVRDKEQVGEMKKNCDHMTLCELLPKEYRHFVSHIENCTYTNPPNYSILRNLIKKAIEVEHICDSDPFDWEPVCCPTSITDDSKKIENKYPILLNSDVHIDKNIRNIEKYTHNKMNTIKNNNNKEHTEMHEKSVTEKKLKRFMNGVSVQLSQPSSSTTSSLSSNNNNNTSSNKNGRIPLAKFSDNDGCNENYNIPRNFNIFQQVNIKRNVDSVNKHQSHNDNDQNENEAIVNGVLPIVFGGGINTVIASCTSGYNTMEDVKFNRRHSLSIGPYNIDRHSHSNCYKYDHDSANQSLLDKCSDSEKCMHKTNGEVSGKFDNFTQPCPSRLSILNSTRQSQRANQLTLKLDTTNNISSVCPKRLHQSVDEKIVLSKSQKNLINNNDLCFAGTTGDMPIGNSDQSQTSNAQMTNPIALSILDRFNSGSQSHLSRFNSLVTGSMTQLVGLDLSTKDLLADVDGAEIMCTPNMFDSNRDANVDSSVKVVSDLIKENIDLEMKPNFCSKICENLINQMANFDVSSSIPNPENLDEFNPNAMINYEPSIIEEDMMKSIFRKNKLTSRCQFNRTNFNQFNLELQQKQQSEMWKNNNDIINKFTPSYVLANLQQNKTKSDVIDCKNSSNCYVDSATTSSAICTNTETNLHISTPLAYVISKNNHKHRSVNQFSNFNSVSLRSSTHHLGVQNGLMSDDLIATSNLSTNRSHSNLKQIMNGRSTFNLSNHRSRTNWSHKDKELNDKHNNNNSLCTTSQDFTRVLVSNKHRRHSSSCTRGQFIKDNDICNNIYVNGFHNETCQIGDKTKPKAILKSHRPFQDNTIENYPCPMLNKDPKQNNDLLLYNLQSLNTHLLKSQIRHSLSSNSSSSSLSVPMNKVKSQIYGLKSKPLCPIEVLVPRPRVQPPLSMNNAIAARRRRYQFPTILHSSSNFKCNVGQSDENKAYI